MEEKDVDVSLSGDTLTIKGEKRQERQQKGDNLYLSERSYGAFQRSFSLPENVTCIKAEQRPRVRIRPWDPGQDHPSQRLPVKSGRPPGTEKPPIRGECQMPDDLSLQTMVMDELAWEPSIDAAHIGVAVKNGVVTLSGFVDSYIAQAAVEHAASSWRQGNRRGDRSQTPRRSEARG